MRRQLPGVRNRKPARGLLKPQHRMVLGLVSMSAASLMLSLIFQKKGSGSRRTGSSRAVPGAEVPLPTGLSPSAEGASQETISAAVAAAGPAVRACVEAWAPELEPWAGASTTIEVQLGATGLARADVLRMKGAPAPFLGCLGAGLGAVGWPSGGEDIVLVRVPLRIEAAPRVVPLPR